MSDLATRAAQRADLNVRSADSLVERLAEKYRDRITGYFVAGTMPCTPFPDAFPFNARCARRGTDQLYSQRAAWDASARGDHVVAVTPTIGIVAHTCRSSRPCVRSARRCTCFRPRPWRRIVVELLELNRAASSACARTFDGDTPNDAWRSGTHGDTSQ